MLPVIHIGPLALPAPQLILLLGFWIGLELTVKLAPTYRIEPGKLYNLVLVALLAGLIGARLAYAAHYPAAFRENPASLLALRPDMLDTSGGWLTAILAGLTYGTYRKTLSWSMLDALTTLLAVLGIVAGLAHLASGDAFGAPAQLPWAIDLLGEKRHPSQIYEILAALIVAVIIWPRKHISTQFIQPGQEGLRMWAFLALSAVAQIMLETFRGDSILLWNTFRLVQILAWGVLAVSLRQIGKRIKAHPEHKIEDMGETQDVTSR